MLECARRGLVAALLALTLAGCNASDGAPDVAKERTQEARPTTKDVDGTGYAVTVPRSWVELSARESARLRIKKADLAVADRPRGCTSNVALPDSTPPSTVQPAVLMDDRTVVPADSDPSCALQGHRQVVFVTRAANVPPVTTATAEQQVRQVFETLGPDLRYTTQPRVDVDQIEGAHVVAKGKGKAGQQLRLDGVVAYSGSSLYFVFMMQLGQDARAQDKSVSELLDSWEWR